MPEGGGCAGCPANAVRGARELAGVGAATVAVVLCTCMQRVRCDRGLCSKVGTDMAVTWRRVLTVR